jgi:hypothetical protein
MYNKIAGFDAGNALAGLKSARGPEGLGTDFNPESN